MNEKILALLLNAEDEVFETIMNGVDAMNDLINVGISTEHLIFEDDRHADTFYLKTVLASIYLKRERRKAGLE